MKSPRPHHGKTPRRKMPHVKEDTPVEKRFTGGDMIIRIMEDEGCSVPEAVCYQLLYLNQN